VDAFFWDVLQDPNSVISKKMAFFINCFSDKVLAENFRFDNFEGFETCSALRCQTKINVVMAGMSNIFEEVEAEPR
jgi:hypothetical protein